MREKNTVKRLFMIAAAIASAASPVVASAPRYKLAKSVSLGAPDRWDFVHFDPVQNCVYVAHRTQIDVIDGKTGAIVGRVAGIAGAHDVATVPALGRGYADNSDTGDVTVFDLRTLRPMGKISADADSDAMIYDSATGLLVVANGDSHDASIIDVRSSKRLANVPLGGSPEMMVPDGEGKVFINVASANQVIRLDLRSRAIDARWPTPGCESPHGLAIDAATRRLFLSCANARMLVMDATNGKSLALLPIGSGTDGAVFDPIRKWVFSSNRDGTLSVVGERTAKSFVALGKVTTAPGARTMAIDPRTGRIFLVTAAVSGQRPPKAPGEPPEHVFAPGTVKLMMFDPEK